MEVGSNAVSGESVAISVKDDSITLTKNPNKMDKVDPKYSNKDRWRFLFHYYTMLIVFQVSNYGKEETRFEDLPLLTRSYVGAFILFGLTTIVQWAVHDMRNMGGESLSRAHDSAFDRFIDSFLWFVWRFTSIYAPVSLVVILIQQYIA